MAAAKEHFGDRGLYVVAAVSGLTDMDAITISTAQMMVADGVAIDTGGRMMFVVAMSNVLFKGLVLAALGSRQLFLWIGVLFGASLLGTGAGLWLWPAVR